MRTITIMILILLSPCLSSAQDELIIRKAKKEITLTGYTRCKTTVTLSSEVSGKLLRVNYDVGEIIREKPFFEVDPTFIGFHIQNARHSLEKLKIAREQTESRVSYLRKEFRRIDNLLKRDTATKVRRDAAAEDLKQAEFEVRSLTAEKAALETTLKELEERRARHTIYGPKAWVVVKKMVEPGEVIGQNMPLAQVSDYRTLTVPLAVSGQELDTIKQLPREFGVLVRDTPANASINWINPEFNETTRKLAIELILVRYRGERRGGLRVSLNLEIETDGFLVPKAAVINRYDNPKITLKETGETINVMVLGESDEGFIVTADERLKPGMPLMDTGN